MNRNVSDWRTKLALNAAPDLWRAWLQLSGGLTTLAFLTTAMYFARGTFLLPLLAIPAGFVLVRLFIIQHDCGHGSFFDSRTLNNFVGRLISIFTVTPYNYWRTAHAEHHVTSGNIEESKLGSLKTLTVRDYETLNSAQRLGYRIYRNPVVLLAVAPTYQFLLRQRVPINIPKPRGSMCASIWGNNALILLMLWVAESTIGLGVFLQIALPIWIIFATVGVWLFYVQHQFEQTYWEKSPHWKFEEAALKGSSFYDLPRFMHFLTGNIGVHHLHHLMPLIPNYRLRSALGAHPELLEGTNVISFTQSLNCLRLALWDEQTRKLISFRTHRDKNYQQLYETETDVGRTTYQ